MCRCGTGKRGRDLPTLEVCTRANKGERGRHQQAGKGQDASAGGTGSGGWSLVGGGGIRPYMHAQSAYRLDTSMYMRSRLWIHVHIRPPGTRVESTLMYELVWMSGRTSTRRGTRSPPARLAGSLARMTHDPALLRAVDCSPYGNETRQVTCQFYRATMRRPDCPEQLRADRSTGHRACRDISRPPIACSVCFLNCKLPPREQINAGNQTPLQPCHNHRAPYVRYPLLA